MTWSKVQQRWQEFPQQEYQCLGNLNLYDSPELNELATQAVALRHLRFLDVPASDKPSPALQVQLCEDDYPGWLAVEDLDLLEPAPEPYRAIALSTVEIGDLLPGVIDFAHRAMQQPNYYLWGGTTGPNYDCSGLVQSAFASVGIWLPRDAYQQEAFVQPISVSDLAVGDLVFFGSAERCTHVGVALGDSSYIHSSGKAIGRNGIGIDWLVPEMIEQQDEFTVRVSQAYLEQVRGAGRVVRGWIGESSG